MRERGHHGNTASGNGRRLLGWRFFDRQLGNFQPALTSKVKLWMPTRLFTGEGPRTGKNTDTHLFVSAGQMRF
jgi:hypothetical protein